MDSIKNIEIIQEFDSEIGIRGIYKFDYEGDTRIVARKDNNFYSVVHLSDKPELMKVREDVSKLFLSKLQLMGENE